MPKEVVTMLKTYCESGTFARGKDALSGSASLALFGNTNQPVEIMVRSSHLFAPMPDVIREDMAFLDRLHFYLPGWEVSKMRNEFFIDHYGFVVDYLAEALRDLRRHNFTEIFDRYFSLGSHLNARDTKAVRKTVAGLVKLIHPHGEPTKEEIADLLDLAIEGRRRVKEQLKKIGAFEYYQTSFSYIDVESREERYVGVPEEGGRALIATDPLASGSVYASSVETVAVEPTVRPLHHPPLRLALPLARVGGRAPLRDVRCVAALGEPLAHVVEVIALIAAQVLRRDLCRLRPFDRHRVHHPQGDSLVVPVGSGHAQCWRRAPLVTDDVALRAPFPAIHGGQPVRST
jgi:hypothetical protein